MPNFVAATMPASRSWRDVVWGTDTFVAVATSSAYCATSPDGITWTTRSMPASGAWNAVAHDGSQFVAIATGTTDAATSPDGITWTARTTAAAAGWSSLAYGAGLFVALTNDSSDASMTSPDGITWTSRTMPSAGIYYALTFGNGVFCALKYGTDKAYTSPDGISWTERTIVVEGSWQDVTYGNGLFVAVSKSTSLVSGVTSADGITWTARTIVGNRAWQSVAAAAGMFAAIAQGGTVAATSEDGVTWTEVTLPSTRTWYSVAYGGGAFAAIASSTNAGAYYAFEEVAAPSITADSTAATMLGAALVESFVDVAATCSAPSPLRSPIVKAYNDFTDQLGDAITRYVMDLTTPGGLVRVPISSWQATLQTGASNYVQCVVPAVADWVDSINAATAFTITRTATPAGGETIEYEMASAPLEQIQLSQGPTNFSGTLSGYSTAFAEDEAPDSAYDRTLAGVRSVASGSSGYRVRCAIDWLLRPAQRAYLPDGSSFVVSYVNYYQPQGNDSYMDVGE